MTGHLHKEPGMPHQQKQQEVEQGAISQTISFQLNPQGQMHWVQIILAKCIKNISIEAS